MEDLIARVEKNHAALSEDVAKLTGGACAAPARCVAPSAQKSPKAWARARRARVAERLARARTGRKVQKLNPVQQLIKTISDQTQKVSRTHHLPPARPAPAGCIRAPAGAYPVLFCTGAHVAPAQG